MTSSSCNKYPALCIKRTNKGESPYKGKCYPAAMQDKTIDNALLELRRCGGTQGKLAEVLLDMRQVELPRYYQRNPFRRGETVQIVLDLLRAGPQTAPAIGKAIQQQRPDIKTKAATNRAYQALLRLEAKGMVRREKRIWRSTT